MLMNSPIHSMSSLPIPNSFCGTCRTSQASFKIPISGTSVQKQMQSPRRNPDYPFKNLAEPSRYSVRIYLSSKALIAAAISS